MKQRKWLLTVSLLAVFLLALAACGGRKATSTPQAGPIAPPEGATPPASGNAPEPTLEPTVELDLSALSAAKDLNSYRSTTTITVKGTRNDQPIQETIDLRVEYTRQPLMQHLSMTTFSSQQVTGTGTIDIYQTHDTQYLKMGEDWISTPLTDTNDLTSGLVTGDQMLKNTCGWQHRGTGDLGGVRVRHWTLSKSAMDACLPSRKLFGQGEITNLGGDLYVALDGSYVAGLNLFFEGTNLGLFSGSGGETAVEQGRLDMNYAISDVNQPITLQVPPEALQAGALPADIPTPADAQGASQAFGMITFTSASTPQQIADFYQAEMPKSGWSAGDSADLGGVLSLEFSKGARTARLMISTDAATGQTQVLIQVEGE